MRGCRQAGFRIWNQALQSENACSTRGPRRSVGPGFGGQFSLRLLRLRSIPTNNRTLNDGLSTCLPTRQGNSGRKCGTPLGRSLTTLGRDREAGGQVDWALGSPRPFPFHERENRPASHLGYISGACAGRPPRCLDSTQERLADILKTSVYMKTALGHRVADQALTTEHFGG